jgi:parallel beta-helix repeat protein
MKRLAFLVWVASGPLAATTFTVVNTADSGAGSLRDALTSAQNCAGAPHTIAFDVPAGSLTNGVAVIVPGSALPAITCAGTTLDGTTQTANQGNTNDVLLGTGGTVGTGIDGIAGTGDEAALPQLNGPEVQIQGGGGISPGLAVNADDVTIRGIAIYGFGSGDTTGNIVVGNVANTLIEGNVIGAAATAFTSTGVPFGNNVTSVSDPGVGSATTVRNNLIGFSGATGILALGPNALIEDNEIRQSGATEVEDAIGALATPFVIRRNLIVGSSGMGIDAGGSGAITVTENTISGNGFGSSTERSGVYVSSTAGRPSR